MSVGELETVQELKYQIELDRIQNDALRLEFISLKNRLEVFVSISLFEINSDRDKALEILKLAKNLTNRDSVVLQKAITQAFYQERKANIDAACPMCRHGEPLIVESPTLFTHGFHFGTSRCFASEIHAKYYVDKRKKINR